MSQTPSTSSTSSSSSSSPTSKSTPSTSSPHGSGRDINSLLTWANEQGILQENGFSLQQRQDDDWNVRLDKTQNEITKQGTRLLQIPEHLIWSSANIRQELMKDYATQLEPAVQYLLSKKCRYQIPQFFLVLQLLRQVELGSNSKWYPWIQSLPKTFTTAVSMDEIELECLPPFAWSLAQVERIHCQAFCDAIQNFITAIPTNSTVAENDTFNNNDCSKPPILHPSTAQDRELLEWAFNAVFTRCWGQEEIDDDDDDDEKDKDDSDNDEVYECDMVPLGDMFNHADPANVAIYYDSNGNCNIITKSNTTTILPDSPLTLSYGKATNPSRFLVIFGFCDTNQPQIFCQIIANQPTKKHVKMGYNVNKMTCDTATGYVSPQVWRVVLYSILEQVPTLQETYYQAFVNGDVATTTALEQQYRLEVGIVIRKHFDSTVKELELLLKKIKQQDLTLHPRLSMIQTHNDFVHNTFVKARQGVDEEIKKELERRKSLQKGV